MPISPNLLISPQEKAAVSDTQLSWACCLWENNDKGGERPQPARIRISLLSFFFSGVVVFLFATVGSTCYEMLPC